MFANRIEYIMNQRYIKTVQANKNNDSQIKKTWKKISFISLEVRRFFRQV